MKYDKFDSNLILRDPYTRFGILIFPGSLDFYILNFQFISHTPLLADMSLNIVAIVTKKYSRHANRWNQRKMIESHHAR